MRNNIYFNLAGKFLIFLFTFQLYSQDGTTEWAYTFGGPSYDWASDIITDSDGNVFLLANFDESVDFDTGTGTNTLTTAGFMDSVIIKFDANGTMLWIKQLSSEIDSGIQATSFLFDTSGNLVIGGSFEGTVDLNPGAASFMLTSMNLSRYDGFILKLTQNGEFILGKQIESSHDLVLNKLIVDINNNIAATGWFKNTADFDPGAATYNLTSNGEADVFILKLDSSGDFIWARQEGAEESDTGRGIASDNAGNIFTAGTFMRQVDFDPGAGSYILDATTFTTRRDMFILKLNSLGDFIWVKQIGAESAATSYIDPNALHLDQSGNIYTTGRFFIEADFDPGPNTHNIQSNGVHDIFLSKLDSSGNFIWAKAFLSSSNGIGYEIDFDNAGNVYSTGYFSETVDFDPGSNVYNLTATHYNDMYVLKLTSAGNFVWAVGRGGQNNDIGKAIEIDANGNVYVAGEYGSDMDFGSGINYTSNGMHDMFILKLTQDSLNIDEILGHEIAIFPNPVSEKLYISSAQNLDSIHVYDVSGREVVGALVNQTNITLDMTSYNAGVYFVQVHSVDKVYAYKIIKQ